MEYAFSEPFRTVTKWKSIYEKRRKIKYKMNRSMRLICVRRIWCIQHSIPGHCNIWLARQWRFMWQNEKKNWWWGWRKAWKWKQPFCANKWDISNVFIICQLVGCPQITQWYGGRAVKKKNGIQEKLICGWFCFCGVFLWARAMDFCYK